MAKIQITSGVTVDYSEDGWDEYKKWLDGTYATLQFAWTDEGEAYAIVAPDGDVNRTCSINKTDAADFEANYKTQTPRQVKPPTSADGTLQTGKQPLQLGTSVFQRTDDSTEEMGVDGRPAGAVTVLWNGDGTYWTPSGVGSATTGSARTGTYGWDTGLMANDDEIDFTNSINIDPDDFSSLSLWVQPKAVPGNAEPRIRWKTTTGANKGSELDLNDYVSDWDLDVWQKITIPMADFGINEDDDVGQLHFQFHNAGQHFWIDDIELTEPGAAGPYVFRVDAEAGTLKHVTMAVLLIVAPGAGWNPTAFADIVGGLTNGLLLRHRRLSTDTVLWSMNSKDNIDLFGRYHPQDDVTFANGDLLVGFMVKPGNASVVVTDDDVLEVVVRDDLSTLSRMRGYLHYGVEVAP